MANPTDVPCPAGVWTLVATAIQTGWVEIRSSVPSAYFWTDRDTGGLAPTTLAQGSGFGGKVWGRIGDSEQIDVYIWPVGAAGTVRLHS